MDLHKKMDIITKLLAAAAAISFACGIGLAFFYMKRYLDNLAVLMAHKKLDADSSFLPLAEITKSKRCVGNIIEEVSVKAAAETSDKVMENIRHLLNLSKEVTIFQDKETR